jgi:hypothetical protein
VVTWKLADLFLIVEDGLLWMLIQMLEAEALIRNPVEGVM